MNRRDFTHAALLGSSAILLPDDWVRIAQEESDLSATPSPDNRSGRMGSIPKGPLPITQSYPGMMQDFGGKIYVVDHVDHVQGNITYKELPKGCPQ